MIIVLKLEGKGTGRADYASVHTFEDRDEALQFIAENTVDAKYWKTATIVQSGEVVETQE